MQNKKEKKIIDQVMYLDRWVERQHFRAFVYNEKEQKLANSYTEFESLIASGLWHAEKLTNVSLVKGKQKHGNSDS